MELHPDWKEFLRLLNSHGVEYLIVGAHALAFHGHPRYTADIDFFIRTTQANAERLYDVLCEFGFGDSLDGPEDLLKQPAVFMLGRQPFRIDLLNQIDGVEFAGAWERRVVSELDGISVPFISLEDYVANKRAAGRKKDAYDLEALGVEPEP